MIHGIAAHIVSVHVQVDIDLAAEGNAAKVSRQQAQLSLQASGVFQLVNTGRRVMFVNGVPMRQHQGVSLKHLSLVTIGNVDLLFFVNMLAVNRVINRSTNLTL